MTQTVEKMAPVILEAIQKSTSILLHCHPSPDPDSVGSALVMRFALLGMGKKVTVIKGDSDIPQAFMHFPGAHDIVKKSFTEIDLGEFDLFIILDSGSEVMISQFQTPKFPLPVKSVAIDHHSTNSSFADINLIDVSSPATAFTLYKLFKLWGVSINPSIAANLFIGMYTDTGGFTYPRTSSEVFKAVSELVEIVPNFHEIVSIMHNSRRKQFLVYQAVALSSLKTFCNDKIALTAVPCEEISKNGILPEDMSSVPLANILISVSEFCVAGSMVESEPNKVKISFRSKDTEKYDVSKLAVALGGGGHKAAAGARLNMSLEEALKKVVETAKILYNL